MCFGEDFSQCLVVGLFYWLLWGTFKMAVQVKYFSIKEIVNAGTLDKIKYSFICNVANIVISSLLFLKCFNFSKNNIQVGLFVAAFLIVWPSLCQYSLFVRPVSLYKVKYVTFLILYLIIFYFLTYFILYTMIPIIFDGSKGSFLENLLSDNMFQAIICFALLFIQYRLIKKEHLNGYDNLTEFKTDFSVFLRQYKAQESIIKHSCVGDIIKKASQKVKLDENVLRTIVIVESINRGGLFRLAIEYFVCMYLPIIACKLDLSVGISQVKISTASKFANNSPNILARKLCLDKYNLYFCARYLKDIIEKYYQKNGGRGKDLAAYIVSNYNGYIGGGLDKGQELYAGILRKNIEFKA